MPPSLGLALFVTCLTATSFVYAAESAAPKSSKDTPIQLDKFAAAAEKENNFSLPLDAVAASAPPAAPEFVASLFLTKKLPGGLTLSGAPTPRRTLH